MNEAIVENGGCGYINKDSLFVMSIRKSPSMDEAIAQLAEIQRVFVSQPLTEELVETINRMCHQVYGFLDKQLEPDLDSKESSSDYTQKDIQHLKVSSVWTGKQFVSKEVVGSGCTIDGPYLYKIPASILSRKRLIESLQIKKQFCLKDIEKALKAMKKDFKDQPVDERCQIVLHFIVTLLHQVKLNVAPTLMLPDEHVSFCASQTNWPTTTHLGTDGTLNTLTYMASSHQPGKEAGCGANEKLKYLRNL